ncbi:MAG: hypothetical protein A2Y88_06775 [Chloroflexi bacterium RBG_13_48_10]|nr:MAG: hypothetical protein A2Y88_06775 [Chloroflexi bacterium RBG_13_48_10]
MPRLDGTGPQGAGPMTGRGIGYCGSNSRGRFYNSAPGLRGAYGLGYRGRGRGWRNRFYTTGVPGWVPPTPEQEIAELNTWAEQLKTQLDAIQKRIEELKS